MKYEPKNQTADLLCFKSVPSTFLAELLGLTRQRVSQLRGEGVIQDNGKRGHYDLFAAVPAYLDHLRANKGSDVSARLKLAQVEKIQQYVEKMENELVKTSDAAAVFRAASTAWRNEASKLPQRVARRIAKSEDPSAICELLRDELDQVFYRFEKGLNQHRTSAISGPRTAERRDSSGQRNVRFTPGSGH